MIGQILTSLSRKDDVVDRAEEHQESNDGIENAKKQSICREDPIKIEDEISRLHRENIHAG